MPDSKMVSPVDYMKGFCTCGRCHAYINAKLEDASEPVEWPINVYTVGNVFLGLAYGKQAYMNLWNSNSDCVKVGELSGWYGPFTFLIHFKCGSPIPSYLGVGGYDTARILLEDGDARLMEDGSHKLHE